MIEKKGLGLNLLAICGFSLWGLPVLSLGAFFSQSKDMHFMQAGVSKLAASVDVNVKGYLSLSVSPVIAMITYDYLCNQLG